MTRTPAIDDENAFRIYSAAADRRDMALARAAATRAARTGAPTGDAGLAEFAAIFAVAPDVEKLQDAAILLLSAASIDPGKLTIDEDTIREVCDLMLNAYGQTAKALIAAVEAAEA